MHFNLISNIHNGAGLERDCQIVGERLDSAGHTSRGLQFNAAIPADARADVNIFLEVLDPRFFGMARRQWIFVNAEWFAVAWKQHLPKFELVIVKTRHAYELMRPIARKDQLVYTGFESRDFYDPQIPREPTFLHVAGKSRTKNTAEIIEAWKGGGLPRLTLVSAFNHGTAAGIEYVTRVSDEDLIKLRNRNLFAIHPSSYEGFGHSIWESLGCGAVILTTDAEPMRSIGEHCPDGLIAESGIRPRTKWLQNTYIVSPKAIRDAVKRVIDLPTETIADCSARSREKYLTGRWEFRELFKELISR